MRRGPEFPEILTILHTQIFSYWYRYIPKYKNASTWAVAELDKVAEYGFITDNIKDKMNGPITREEFCEVAIKLYENDG